MVKANHKSHAGKSVFQRVKEATRNGGVFVPTPIPGFASRVSNTTAITTTYASIPDFAGMTGLTVEEVEWMLESGGLTHILVGRDGQKIHVAKALRDLELLEKGGSSTA